MARPAIFDDFCAFFHQDVWVVYDPGSGLSEAFEDFAARRDPAELDSLRRYLSSRLGADVHELEAEWSRSRAGIDFFDGTIADFYRRAFDWLESRASAAKPR